MRTVLCPRASGVLAALGLVAAERRADAQRSLLLSGEAFTAEAVAEAVRELGTEARGELGDEAAELRTVCELRYRGQAFELSIEAGPHPDPAKLADGFHAAHEERYGYADRDTDVELVTVRVTATLPGTGVDLAPAADAAFEERTRTAVLGGEEVEAAVFRGEPPAGFAHAGPALVELRESTLAVPPGWSVRTDDSGTLVMERDA
jgi:N-methylhydantoinase A